MLDCECDEREKRRKTDSGSSVLLCGDGLRILPTSYTFFKKEGFP